MAHITDLLKAIEESPEGPQVCAIFDFDGECATSTEWIDRFTKYEVVGDKCLVVLIGFDSEDKGIMDDPQAVESVSKILRSYLQKT